MKLITTFFLIIAVTDVINAASVGRAEDEGRSLQSPHIVGGVPANFDDYRPSMFHMKFYEDQKLVLTCTGTEIKVHQFKYWWLTAAECLNSEKYAELIVEVMFRKSFIRYSVKMSELKYIIHPNYNNVTKENNIALIHPAFLVLKDERVVLSKLPEQGETFATRPASIYLEWKNITKNSDSKEDYELNLIRTKVIKPTWCSIWYPLSIIKKQHVCASGWYGKGLLKSDVGIPLVALDQDLMFKVIGIAAVIRPWTRWFGLPIEFLSIEPYVEWIQCQWSSFNV